MRNYLKKRDVTLRSAPDGLRRVGPIKRFLRTERGSIYALAAFMALPLIGLVGIGADTAKLYLAKAKFSQALDAAALASAKQGVLAPSTYNAIAKKYFKLNFPNGYLGATITGPTVSTDAKGEKVKVKATLKVNTDFMHLFGVDTLDISHETEVTRQTVKMDIVMSIDMSGSMGNYVKGKRKIDSARDAAKTLINVLYGDEQSNSLLKIGLVPWNGNVNVKIDGRVWDGTSTKKFLSSSFKNPITGANQNFVFTTKASPVAFINQPNSSWKGCVYARYKKDAYTTNDADILYGSLKHFTGDWEAFELRNDNQIGTYKTVCKNKKVKYKHCWINKKGKEKCKWKNKWVEECNEEFTPASSYTKCLKHGITPLTSSRSDITSAVNALKTPDGFTNLAQGLAWSWRVLMPTAPFTEGTKDDPKVRLVRAVVLLSDGSQCSDTGDGYKAVWGDDCSSSANGEMDKRLKLLAANMKKAGVIVYAIQFGTNSSSLAKLLKEVASSDGAPHYYFAPDAAALKTAFTQVATSLSDLRISK